MKLFRGSDKARFGLYCQMEQFVHFFDYCEIQLCSGQSSLHPSVRRVWNLRLKSKGLQATLSYVGLVGTLHNNYLIFFISNPSPQTLFGLRAYNIMHILFLNARLYSKPTINPPTRFTYR